MPIFNVIRFDGIQGGNWLIYRHPVQDFNVGSQLIVNESQVAVFFKGGVALDVFTAGTYTLSTDNIPLLRTFINLPFGGQTPFSAEIYFINKVMKLDFLWGTQDPIQLIDPKYGVRLRIRAFGQFGTRIRDYQNFLTQIVGAMPPGQVTQFLKIKDYFKSLLITKVKTIISKIIIAEKISALEITPKLEELSDKSKAELIPEFDKFGLEIINFFIESVNFPEEDFDAIDNALESKAEFDILGSSRYTSKRSFDAIETAAGNEGSGNLAGAGIGLGIGMGAGPILANTLGNMTKAPEEDKKDINVCPSCGRENDIESAFCSGCGKKLPDMFIECPKCKKKNIKGASFCTGCGTDLTNKTCGKCGSSVSIDSAFCNKCGNKMEE